MILCVPPNSLTSSQKGTLTKKGYIVIETDNPDKVRVIAPEKVVATDDYYMAALHSLCVKCPVNQQQEFVNELYKRLKSKEVVEAEEIKTDVKQPSDANPPETVLKEPIKAY